MHRLQRAIDLVQRLQTDQPDTGCSVPSHKDPYSGTETMLGKHAVIAVIPIVFGVIGNMSLDDFQYRCVDIATFRDRYISCRSGHALGARLHGHKV